PRRRAPRRLGSALEDGVAVALALAEDGQDQRSGRGGDEVLADVHGWLRPTFGDRRTPYIGPLYIVPLSIARAVHPGGTAALRERYRRLEKRRRAVTDSSTPKREGRPLRRSRRHRIVAGV